MSNELGEIIDEIKFRNKLTIEDIAFRIGYSRAHLTKIKNKGGSKKAIEALAKEFPEITQSVINRLSSGSAQNVSSADQYSNLKEIALRLSNLEFGQSLIRTDIANSQAMIRAEVRGYGQYQIRTQVHFDEQAFLKAMAEVGRIIGANLQVGELRDIPVSKKSS